MQLLALTAQTHKSLRDEAVWDLVAGSKPLSAFPAVGIFGANASGKSTVLDALRYVVAAVRESASSWLSYDQPVRAPFRFDKVLAEGPSRYELDFMIEGTRHQYGFEIDPAGIVQEWLGQWATSRRRSLFHRERDQVQYGRGVASTGPLAPTELLLSRALRLGHELLKPVAQAISDGVTFAPFGDAARQHRVHEIIDQIASMSPGTLQTVLQIADIGIEEVTVREDVVPPEVLSRVQRALALLSGSDPEPPDDGRAPAEELSQTTKTAVARSLEFHHQPGGAAPLLMDEESDGTLAWLALAVPAINRLRQGGVYVVDELDSSLHPYLAQTLIGFFQDRQVNTQQAQLLFTSHDSYLLSNQCDLNLAKGQIWFTEKERDGSTSLFSLADFTRHRDDNVAKRYLEGRYGAVPVLAPSLVHRLLPA